MSVKKSKPFEIGGSKYSFNFVGGKLVGIQKANGEGNFDGNYLKNIKPKIMYLLIWATTANGI